MSVYQIASNVRKYVKFTASHLSYCNVKQRQGGWPLFMTFIRSSAFLMTSSTCLGYVAAIAASTSQTAAEAAASSATVATASVLAATEYNVSQ